MKRTSLQDRRPPFEWPQPSFLDVTGTRRDDRLLGTPGTDDFDISLVSFTNVEQLQGSDGDDVVFGHEGRNVVYGRAGWDEIHGSGGSDVLYGDKTFDRNAGAGSAPFRVAEAATASQDSLYGEDGADTLVGGLGSDYLVGGSGRDRFVYEKVADSTEWSGDRIIDFERGFDRIDLSAIDANPRREGNQAFHFGSTPGITGDVRLSFDPSTGATSVLIYTDNDTAVDLMIYLMGNHLDLTAASFVL